jgi:hypothetical protein
MTTRTQTSNVPMIVFAWCAVGIPLLWGVYETLLKAAALFQ